MKKRFLPENSFRKINLNLIISISFRTKFFYSVSRIYIICGLLAGWCLAITDPAQASHGIFSHGKSYSNNTQVGGLSDISDLLPALPQLQLATADPAEDDGFSFLSLIPASKISGYTGYRFSANQQSGSDQTSENSFTGGAGLSSYIWQPWFARVKGDFDATQSLNNTGTSNTNSTRISGNLSFNILPLSRYPLTLSYGRSDSSVTSTNGLSSATTSSSTISDILTLSALYQWDTSLNFKLRTSVNTTEREEESNQTSYQNTFGVSKIYDDHRINFQTSSSLFLFEDMVNSEDSESLSNSISLRHSYTPWKNVTYHSISSLLLSTSENPLSESEQAMIQNTYTLSWTPRDQPITITGISRTLADLKTTSDTSNSSSAGETKIMDSALNGQLGITYRYSPKVDMTFSGDASYSSTDLTTTTTSNSLKASTVLSTGATGTASYKGDQQKVLDWNWGWGTTGSLSTNITPEQRTHSQAANINQSIRRDFSFPLFPRLSVVGNEGLTLNKSIDSPVGTSVSHGLRLSESNSSESRWTSSSVSFTDSRTLSGLEKSSRQLVNLQVNNTLSLTQKSKLSIAVSAQTSRQTSETAKAPWTTSSNGNIDYIASNFLDMPNLNFVSSLTFSSDSLIPLSLKTSTTESEDAVSWNRDWKVGLKFALGMLRSDLTLKMSENESSPRATSLSFNIRRQF